MADRNNELNDIILNGKKEKTRTNKKILLGIGGMTLILIIIVTIMGRIMHTEESQLPSVSPSTQSNKPEIPETTATVKEALEEINKNNTETSSIELDTITEQISNKLKEENLSEKKMPEAKVMLPKTPIEQELIIEEPVASTKIEAKKPQVKKSVEMPAVKPAKKTTVKNSSKNSVPTAGSVYIQVGAFSQYKPEKGFLQKITKAGYTYTFFRLVKNGSINNKVLVGPFTDNADARKNLIRVRKAIEPGAFIYTINQ